ncbi:MAG: hypothetical protein Q7R95_00035 [bacterium]|nr:hypothetical protein [bacterium]
MCCEGKMNKKLLIILSIVIGILLISTGVVIAFVITALTPEKVSVYSSTVEDSDFTVSALDTKFQGATKIKLDIEFTNTDSVSHSANITVQILNSTSHVVVENTQLSGVVLSSGTYSFQYTFEQIGLTAAYNKTIIVIDQLT